MKHLKEQQTAAKEYQQRVDLISQWLMDHREEMSPQMVIEVEALYHLTGIVSGVLHNMGTVMDGHIRRRDGT